VANALAAAALASGARRLAEVGPRRAAQLPDRRHRIASVGRVDGVGYVDDSKATNPHAAQASLQAFDPVVWIAGGLAKGATFDGLVSAVRDRLRGVVLLGRDRHVIAEALCDTRPMSVSSTSRHGHFGHGPSRTRRR
jgi:UDP-N-acetylmuramoylalanine--D-glutamate ligase